LFEIWTAQTLQCILTTPPPALSEAEIKRTYSKVGTSTDTA